MTQVASQARLEIDQSQQSLLESVDAFTSLSVSNIDTMLCNIGEQQDHFKKEINGLTHSISISQNKLSSLTTTHMMQQKDCSNTEEKINGLSHELNGLNNTKNVILPHQLNEINHHSTVKLQELHEKKLKLKSLILQNERKINKLLSQCRTFERYFAIRCYVIPDSCDVRISFHQINRYHPEKPYSLTLTLKDNQYKIIDCQGTDHDNEKAVQYLEYRLNSQQIGLSQFIKLTRKYFILSVDKEHSNNDPSNMP